MYRICSVQDFASYAAPLAATIGDEDILNSPFNKSKTVRETHFGFLGLEKHNGSPLTILKWQELHPASGQPRFYSYAPDCWYAKEAFAAETGRLRWYLLHQNIVPNSTDKRWAEQKAMLPADYEVPTAVEEVTKDILAYRKTGVYLNPGVYARVNDTTSDGYRVFVSLFDSVRPDFRLYDDVRPRCDTGVSASRKLL